LGNILVFHGIIANECSIAATHLNCGAQIGQQSSGAYSIDNRSNGTHAMPRVATVTMAL
jgi:hypothetical protein